MFSKAKDGLVDRFEKNITKANVDTLSLILKLITYSKHLCSISLDSSGECFIKEDIGLQLI